MDKLKAFPGRKKLHNNCQGHSLAIPVYEEYQGMDLRDYFAGQALAGYEVMVPGIPMPKLEEAARYCYEVADAMMKQREI